MRFRTETSEFVEQVFDDPGSGSPTRVKASQVFTKYLWREQADVRVDEGEVPLIVATQASHASHVMVLYTLTGCRVIAHVTIPACIWIPGASSKAIAAVMFGRHIGPLCVLLPQVVSDYLTAYDGEDRMMRAGNKPVVQYTYRMAFFKPRAV